MNEVIEKMKEALINDKTLTPEQKKLLEVFIESWNNNLDRLSRDIKNL